MTHVDDDVRTPGSLGHIVVGVDFAEPSLAVAQWVGRHLAQSAQMTLVHVAPMIATPNVVRIGAREEADGARPTGERMRALRGALRGLASVSRANRTAVAVRVGDPAVQLAAYADLVRADLIVIGGSSAYHVVPDVGMSERLLRRTRRPVLIARDVSRPPGTVLATVGEGDNTSTIFAAARMVATPSSARVLWYRQTTRGSLRSHTHFDAVSMVTEPKGEREILEAAERLRADIIVVSSPGFRDDDEPVKGRVDLVRALVRSASCSVLVVHDPAAGPPPSRIRVDRWSMRERPSRNGRDVTPGSDDPTLPAAECVRTDGAA